MQDYLRAMRAFKFPSPFKRVRRLALVLSRARASKHACVQETVFVRILLLKLVFVEAPVKVYVSSILRLCTHASEYESGGARLRTSPTSYVEVFLGKS
jgi:hypothetical protein